MNEGERHLCEWQYRESGNFMTLLFEAISQADSINLIRLGVGFPEEVAAYHFFTSKEGYWDALKNEWMRGGL